MELRRYSPVTSPFAPIVCNRTSRLNENLVATSLNSFSAAINLRTIKDGAGRIAGGSFRWDTTRLGAMVLAATSARTAGVGVLSWPCAVRTQSARKNKPLTEQKA